MIWRKQVSGEKRANRKGERERERREILSRDDRVSEKEYPRLEENKRVEEQKNRGEEESGMVQLSLLTYLAQKFLLTWLHWCLG